MGKFRLNLPIQYTDEQLAIADAKSDRILVRALAGTGKTETVAYMVESRFRDGVGIDDLLVCTFTRSAKAQILKRLAAKGRKTVHVRTIHSVALELARDAFENSGQFLPSYTGGPTFARQSLAILNLPQTDACVGILLRAVAETRGLGEFYPERNGIKSSDLRRAIKVYHDLKRQSREIDWDDLFSIAVAHLHRRYGEVIVDEAQDLTHTQLTLVEALADRRLTLVGDPNQSIFGFTGVRGDVLDSLHDYDAYSLRTSFRSAPEILEVAETLIDETFIRKCPPGKVTFTQSLIDPYQDIAEAIDGGARAVIMRSNAELDRLQKYLEITGLRVKRSSGINKTTPPSYAVELTTIHQAKGNEWDHVVLGGIGSEGFRATPSSDEERRVLYVAATRARRRMDVLFADSLPWEWSRYVG